jgi:hypothetical protein
MRALPKRLAWFGTVALVVAAAILLRDARMPDPRILEGGIVVAVLAAFAGASALVIARLRRSRRGVPGSTPRDRAGRLRTP